MTAPVGASVDAIFVTDASAPWAARHAVAELAAASDHELALRLRLLVSEAVSERVLSHAAAGQSGQVRLHVSVDDGVIHGRVSDLASEGGARRPSVGVQIRDLSAGILGAFADAWGTVDEPGGGRAIWFDVTADVSYGVEDYAQRFALAVGQPA